MITTPFASLYQLLVSGSFSDNPLILAGASLLPTVILSSPLIWAFKQKLLPRFLDIDEEEEDEEEKKEGKKEKKKPTHKLEEEISSASIIADVEMQSIPAEIDVTTM